MTSTKFAVACAQRAKAMTQKVANSQYKSTYKYFRTKNQQADMFVRQQPKAQEKPKNSIAEILKTK